MKNKAYISECPLSQEVILNFNKGYKLVIPKDTKFVGIEIYESGIINVFTRRANGDGTSAQVLNKSVEGELEKALDENGFNPSKEPDVNLRDYMVKQINKT